jgi:DNA-binding transcriptional LysR family regulator
VDVNDTDTAAVDLGDLVPPRRIVLAWHRDRYRSPAARAFEDVAREIAADLHVPAGRGDVAAAADVA